METQFRALASSPRGCGSNPSCRHFIFGQTSQPKMQMTEWRERISTSCRKSRNRDKTILLSLDAGEDQPSGSTSLLETDQQTGPITN